MYKRQAKDHPLSELAQVRPEDLSQWRLLRLSSVANDDSSSDVLPGSGGRCWAAPDYLMLLEMARLGFGWAELPRQLVDAYGFGGLQELRCSGWPRRVKMCIRDRPCGSGDLLMPGKPHGASFPKERFTVKDRF